MVWGKGHAGRKGGKDHMKAHVGNGHGRLGTRVGNWETAIHSSTGPRCGQAESLLGATTGDRPTRATCRHGSKYTGGEGR